uniref:Uncharacterized protein n=1 Tax=Knipowitschia caucasica TaxID=637954 RepID=A0AAV2KUU4_KNICA
MHCAQRPTPPLGPPAPSHTASLRSAASHVANPYCEGLELQREVDREHPGSVTCRSQDEGFVFTADLWASPPMTPGYSKS